MFLARKYVFRKSCYGTYRTDRQTAALQIVRTLQCDTEALQALQVTFVAHAEMMTLQTFLLDLWDFFL